MSFSNQVKNEILSLPIKKNCCRRAFLCGLLYNSRRQSGNSFETRFVLGETPTVAARYLGPTSMAEISERVYAGRRWYHLSFNAKWLSSFFTAIERGENIDRAIPMACESCRNCFVRGIIASLATINDPRGDYRMEFTLHKDNSHRCESLAVFLKDIGFDPKTAIRRGIPLLYFRSNTTISDILNFAGAIQSSFSFANAYIEMDIRNNENRATNCVARNISRSVAANIHQCDAIIKLIKSHKLDLLSNELRQTAWLRLENPDASLSELALLHNPPISKSGLSHRLEKLCHSADELAEE